MRPLRHFRCEQGDRQGRRSLTGTVARRPPRRRSPAWHRRVAATSAFRRGHGPPLPSGNDHYHAGILLARRRDRRAAPALRRDQAARCAGPPEDASVVRRAGPLGAGVVTASAGGNAVPPARHADRDAVIGSGSATRGAHGRRRGTPRSRDRKSIGRSPPRTDPRLLPPISPDSTQRSSVDGRVRSSGPSACADEQVACTAGMVTLSGGAR